MDFRLSSAWLGALATGALCAIAPTVAEAQAAPDDDDDDVAAAPAATAALEEETLIGLGLRLRNVRLPESVLEIFVEDAPGGSSTFGIGAEISRRKGDFELVFGVEYESISVVDGIWVEKDKEPPGDVDSVEFDGFGWITADVTFLNHTRFGQYFALRYGGGAGLGVLLGEVKRTDFFCNGPDLDSCGPVTNPENDQEPYDLPPVFPVLTGIFGAQIRPTPNLLINVEMGIRTLPFFGITGGYYF